MYAKFGYYSADPALGGQRRILNVLRSMCEWYLVNAIECDCYPGWTGARCEIDIDHCELYIIYIYIR